MSDPSSLASNSLRQNVRHLRDTVWLSRDDRDAYTGSSKSEMSPKTQNVDHVIEIQLLEHAALDHASRNREVMDRLREIANSSPNLNVTSSRVNQSKRGPFTAAINRLKKRDGALRDVSVEQLARAGRAKWLVDNGCWDNIQREVVRCYESVEKEMEAKRLTRAQRKIMDEIHEDLHKTLDRIKIF